MTKPCDHVWNFTSDCCNACGLTAWEAQAGFKAPPVEDRPIQADDWVEHKTSDLRYQVEHSGVGAMMLRRPNAPSSTGGNVSGYVNPCEHNFSTVPGVGVCCSLCGFIKPDPDPRLEAAKVRAGEAEATLRVQLAKAAPMTDQKAAGEVESAEEFADALDRLCITCEGHCWDDEAAVDLIESRDTAIREAAKLELIAELRAMASEERFDIIQSNTIVYVASELRAKYTATPATETQPAQDGERR